VVGRTRVRAILRLQRSLCTRRRLTPAVTFMALAVKDWAAARRTGGGERPTMLRGLARCRRIMVQTGGQKHVPLLEAQVPRMGARAARRARMPLTRGRMRVLTGRKLLTGLDKELLPSLTPGCCRVRARRTPH